MTSSRSRSGLPGWITVGSKKYREALVATTLTTCPRLRNSANNSGVLTAATDPVTPKRTLAMAFAFCQSLQRVEQPRGKVGPVNSLLLTVQRSQVGVPVHIFQGVGDHQLRRRLTARLLRHVQQLGIR